jgi:ATP-dependent DNA helicase RecG
VYGDLDLSLLDELPKNRATVHTIVVPKKERDEVYAAMKTTLNAGRQAFVICPRIDEPDPAKAMALRAKSVKEEKKRLETGVFSQYRLGMLHGKMKPKEKEDIMRAFAAHEFDILVTTSVVEVGVNVPNATEMIIEGAERFGLSQLHQLRGRVSRSAHVAHCYLFAESSAEQTRTRLGMFAKAKNGFELAEADLELRGAGELGGGKQWGVSDIGMEALKNLKMVEAARESAKALIHTDPTLQYHPHLLAIVEKRGIETHFE